MPHLIAHEGPGPRKLAPELVGLHPRRVSVEKVASQRRREHRRAVQNKTPNPVRMADRHFKADLRARMAPIEIDLAEVQSVQQFDGALDVEPYVGLMAVRRVGVAVAEHVRRKNAPIGADLSGHGRKAQGRAWGGVGAIERRRAARPGGARRPEMHLSLGKADEVAIDLGFNHGVGSK
jgi:hypothetical protein